MWRSMSNWKMFLCWRCVPLCSPGAVNWRGRCTGANGSSCNSKYLIFFMIYIVCLLLLKMTSFTFTRAQCVSCKCLFCSWRIWQEWTRGDDVETSLSHTDPDRMACLCLELKINLFFLLLYGILFEMNLGMDSHKFNKRKLSFVIGHRSLFLFTAIFNISQSCSDGFLSV